MVVSNTSSGSGSSTNQPPLPANKRKEEARLVEALRSALKVHWHSVVLPKLKEQKSKLDDLKYRQEIIVLTSLSRFGLYEGAIAFTGSFLMMRMVMPRILTRFSTRTGTSFTSSSLPKNNPFTSTTRQPHQDASSSASASSRLALDLSFSILAGTYAAIYLADRRDMIHQLSQIPLISGKSILADEFCGVVQDYIQGRYSSSSIPYNSQQQVYDWNKVENMYLVEAHNFAMNCSKRQAMERNLKQEQGLGEDDDVVIPIGGVPVDYPVMMENFGQVVGQQNDETLSFNNEESTSSWDKDVTFDFPDENNVTATTTMSSKNTKN